jgi:hypothetical protein
MSFAKKPALQPGQQRLQKAVAKRLTATKEERARFIHAVVTTKATPEMEERAEQLIQQARQARQAPFLQQYRRTAG